SGSEQGLSRYLSGASEGAGMEACAGFGAGVGLWRLTAYGVDLSDCCTIGVSPIGEGLLMGVFPRGTASCAAGRRGTRRDAAFFFDSSFCPMVSYRPSSGTG
ncbi:hypothetical protein PMAYCL1PPCAC_28503, partial [Pristionchus mayeri]